MYLHDERGKKEKKINNNQRHRRLIICVRQYHVKSISFCDCDDMKDFFLFM